MIASAEFFGARNVQGFSNLLIAVVRKEDVGSERRSELGALAGDVDVVRD